MSDEVRDKLSLYGIAHEDLTDEQLAEASERIVKKFAGQTPDLQDIAIVVDQVRHARSKECPVCTAIRVPYPSGYWICHSKFCPDQPKEKIRREGHPAGANKETKRLRAVHAAEDTRSAVIPIRQVGSCAKCGGPTTRLPYCRPCRTLLSIVRGRA